MHGAPIPYISYTMSIGACISMSNDACPIIMIIIVCLVLYLVETGRNYTFNHVCPYILYAQ